MILSMDDPDFGDKFVKAMNLSVGDRVEIRTPQFERTDGRKVTYIPKTWEEFDALKRLPDEALIEIGLQVWSKKNGKTHWLYPKEWYNHIPDAYTILMISGNLEYFSRKRHCDDHRAGALAYGFER